MARPSRFPIDWRESRCALWQAQQLGALSDELYPQCDCDIPIVAVASLENGARVGSGLIAWSDGSHVLRALRQGAVNALDALASRVGEPLLGQRACYLNNMQ